MNWVRFRVTRSTETRTYEIDRIFRMDQVQAVDLVPEKSEGAPSDAPSAMHCLVHLSTGMHFKIAGAEARRFLIELERLSGSKLAPEGLG